MTIVPSAATDLVAADVSPSGPAARLSALLAAQRAAFARGAPDLRARLAALGALRDGLRAHQEELARAVSEDYGGRPREETLLLELFPLYDQIRHARRHLRRWMRPRRVGSVWFLQPSRAYVTYQPLGAVGVIGAWNYQLLLTLGPLVDALAAGNHVMVKPSEITPRSAELIAKIIGERFPPEYLAAVTGDSEVAIAFSNLPFDHLLFTGSTRVGKLVMRAASEHLTPVTLELGGKSPAIVHERYPLPLAMERVLTGKLYNAGQTCVAPDYLLVPERRVAEIEPLARRIVREMYPSLVANPDYTRIVSAVHWERLTAAVADAAERGARVARIDPADEQFDVRNRVFPPTLVFGAPENAIVMREEIFGPILPIVAYRSLDDAIAYVNARPRPLALYYFDVDRSRIDALVRGTSSGGVCVNDVVVHLGQHNLPFGGVGPSGMGHYHGFDGFETFSKKRGVMVQRRWTPASFLRPPYGPRTVRLVDRLLRLAAGR